MGRERDCEARIDGKTSHGRALLETTEIVFRGSAYRLRFPLATLKQLAVDGEALTFSSGEQRVSLGLGAVEAGRWVDAIRNPKSRADKLGVKAGQRVALVAIDDEALPDELAAKGVELCTARAKALDAIFLGAKSKKDLARVETLRDRLAPAGALWIVRPKGVESITEKDVMAGGKAAGLVDVKVVSLSATHTAEKFVIPVSKRRVTKR